MPSTSGSHAAEGSDETAVSQPIEATDEAHEAELPAEAESDAPAEEKKKLLSPKAGITKAKATLSVSPSKTATKGPPTPLVKKVCECAHRLVNVRRDRRRLTPCA